MSDYFFTQSFDIEFNDSVLDLQGWKGPRYEGSKLIQKEKNVFTPFTILSGSSIPNRGEFLFNDPGRTEAWGGDISYGQNAVIKTDVCALYIGTTLTNGEEDPKIVDVINHSYATIDKFLLINPHTDQIQVVDRLNTNENAFKRFLQTDFPEGSRCRFRLIDLGKANNLKPNYSVKLNEGLLMKVYTYTPNDSGFEDGVFGCFGVRSQKGNPVENYASASSAAVIAQQTDAAGTTSVGGGNIGSVNHTSDGLGLFGLGTTACASASLFTTNSIKFINPFPDELSEYESEVNFNDLGNALNVCTSSYQQVFDNPLDEVQVTFQVAQLPG